MNKIEAIQKSIKPCIHYLNLPEDENIVASDELEREYLQDLHEQISKYVGDNVDNRQWIFDLATIKKWASEGKIKQTMNNIKLFNTILNRYGIGNVDGRRLVYIGDPKLEIYTTSKQMNLELDTLSYIAHKFPGASVRAEETTIKMELDRTIPKRNKSGEVELDENKQPILIKQYGTMSDEQKRGVYACVDTDSIVSSLQGYAGAGKSYTMGAVAKIYKSKGYEIMGITLSWAAAGVLEAESKMRCVAVQNFLQNLRKKKADKQPLFTQPTVIIVDEAGLVGLSQMNELLKFITESPYPVKLILSGDSTQLNPINDPNSLELVEMVIPDEAKATISTIRRQFSASHRRTVLNAKDGYSGYALGTLLQQESLRLCDNSKDIVNSVLNDNFRSMASEPDLTRLILCKDNDMVATFNSQIHKFLQFFGKVDTTEYTIPVKSAKKEKNKNIPSVKEVKFSIGDKMLFTDNFTNIPLYYKGTNTQYKNATVVNKLRGQITHIEGNPTEGYMIKVDIPMIDEDGINGTTVTEAIFHTKKPTTVVVNGEKRKIYPLTKNQSGIMMISMDLNYATTVYSSQGQTVNEVYIVDNESIDCRHAYVALSRHRNDVKVYIDKSNVTKQILKARGAKNENGIMPSTLEILNQVGVNWNKNQLANSVIVHFLKQQKIIKELAHINQTNVDINQLSDSFFNLYQEKLKEIKTEEKSRSQVAFDKRLAYEERFGKDVALTPEDWAGKYVYTGYNIDLLKLSNNIQMKNIAQSLHQEEQKHLAKFAVHTPVDDLEEIEIPLILKPKYNIHPLVDEDFFIKYENKILGIGKGAELRILGTMEDGTVISNYNLNGEDMSQIYYPVMAHDGFNSTHSDVFVIEDFNMYLEMLNKYYLNQEENDKEVKMKPILIWGALETDYAHIISSLSNKKITFYGSDSFKLQHFFKITHSVNGLEPDIEFTNLDKNMITKWYLPSDENPAPRKLPVSHSRYGEYCNSNFLKNIKYQKNNWSNILHLANNEKYSRTNHYEYKSDNWSNFIDEYGRFSQDFIKKMLIDIKQLITPEDFKKLIEDRNNIILQKMNESSSVIKVKASIPNKKVKQSNNPHHKKHELSQNEIQSLAADNSEIIIPTNTQSGSINFNMGFNAINNSNSNTTTVKNSTEDSKKSFSSLLRRIVN